MTCPTELQQAFLGWLEAQGESLTRQVLIDEMKIDHLTFHFDVGFPTLVGWLSERELVVAVMEGDETLDLLVSLDAFLVQDGARWRCGICRNEGKDESFQTCEALWADHFFDPLARWINDTLAPAATLALYRSAGASWAKLMPPDDQAVTSSHLVRVLPLQQLRPHLT